MPGRDSEGWHDMTGKRNPSLGKVTRTDLLAVERHARSVTDAFGEWWADDDDGQQQEQDH